jgi:hypothetical protein
VFDVNHYYEQNDIPEKQEIFKILNDIILDWKKPTKAAPASVV